MHPNSTIIPKFLVLLLLGAGQISAYTPLAKKSIQDLHLSGTRSQQPRPTTSNCNPYCRGKRRLRQDGHISNRSWSSSLASSFSSDEDRADDLDLPINGDNKLKDDGTQMDQQSKDGFGVPPILQRMFDEIPFIHLFFSEGRKKLPPVQVDDFGVLLYDVFLIVNLSASISFWVTHRMDLMYIPSAVSEGCLFSILWIASGLYHGSFLYSAMDGHFPLDDEEGRGGPKAAAALAFNTFINAINLRLVSALIGAWLQHRKVGEGSPMEELIPLEIACGLVLMTMWRALHSQVTPRVR